MKKFRGGVHPHCEKISRSSAIENAELPSKVIIPLQQHVGAPAEAIVEVGQDVKKGQKIGEASGFVSAMIHASISGKIVEIADYLYPNPLGRKAKSVVIESDGKDEWSENIEIPADPGSLGGEQILEVIREAGVVGMGGATFPTNVKFSIPKDKTVDTLILNGVECEPYTTADNRLMIEESDKIVDGLKIMMKAINVQQGYIGVERDKPGAIKAMKKATESEPNIRVAELEVKYPQGWENILIKAILNREARAAGLPLDVGVVVSNVGTAAAISNAFRLGQPLIERVVSVTGPGITQARNLRARVGTPFIEIIEQCGGFKGTPRKVIAGGPMMGFTMFDMSVPVIKGTTNILVFSDKDVEKFEMQTCIRCGRCIQVCPVGLMPTTIASLSEKRLFEDAEKYFPLDCKECGCCAYVCPAKLPLVQLIQFAKADIIARQRAAKVSKAQAK